MGNLEIFDHVCDGVFESGVTEIGQDENAGVFPDALQIGGERSSVCIHGGAAARSVIPTEVVVDHLFVGREDEKAVLCAVFGRVQKEVLGEGPLCDSR